MAQLYTCVWAYTNTSFIFQSVPLRPVSRSSARPRVRGRVPPRGHDCSFPSRPVRQRPQSGYNAPNVRRVGVSLASWRTPRGTGAGRSVIVRRRRGRRARRSPRARVPSPRALSRWLVFPAATGWQLIQEHLTAGRIQQLLLQQRHDPADNAFLVFRQAQYTTGAYAVTTAELEKTLDVCTLVNRGFYWRWYLFLLL